MYPEQRRRMFFALPEGDPGGISATIAGWLSARADVMGVIRVEGGPPDLGSFDMLCRSERAMTWKTLVQLADRRFPRPRRGDSESGASDLVRAAFLDVAALHMCDRYVFVGSLNEAPSDWRRLVSGAFNVPGTRILCAGTCFDACSIYKALDPGRTGDGHVTFDHFRRNVPVLLSTLFDPTVEIKA